MDRPFIKEKYEVDRYPMLLVFSRGREVKRMISVQFKRKLIEAMRTAEPNNHWDVKMVQPKENRDNQSKTVRGDTDERGTW
ncbi:hypothetical protein [Novipirellula artificiosorum]|uniref:Thioredoxin domain-containing protein n=1 Tax=Novipirellula artificiosorum TaxID=2528016 RepID=A0A5C6DIR9_9BACT|nr:hypothetical protein [Novipirellula artificiosorum]TWU34866.1 hypothetical protein Poly41_40090 [Novipirellula artificiosorum]